MAIINEGRLLYAGAPQAAEDKLAGKVWQKSLSKQELAEHQQQFRVISTKLVAGRPLIHIVSDAPPGHGFEKVTPDLEDVFFAEILGVHRTPSLPA
jgi:hypothetical protein